jgi:outer membrane protein
MKLLKTITILALLIGPVGAFGQNQKIGFFESDFVLAQIPEFSGIEQRLQLLSEGWRQEISDMEEEIKALEEDFDAKEILYTDDIRDEKLREIQQKKRTRDTFLNDKFGPDGEYFQSQDELLEPIYRQIGTAVTEVARKQGFDFIFDRSGDIYLFFARTEWNLNEAILLELGIEVE